MNTKRFFIGVFSVLLTGVFLASCSSNNYGMKKRKRKKCDCPTFGQVILPTEHTSDECFYVG